MISIIVEDRELLHEEERELRTLCEKIQRRSEFECYPRCYKSLTLNISFDVYYLRRKIFQVKIEGHTCSEIYNDKKMLKELRSEISKRVELWDTNERKKETEEYEETRTLCKELERLIGFECYPSNWRFGTVDDEDTYIYIDVFYPHSEVFHIIIKGHTPSEIYNNKKMVKELRSEISKMVKLWKIDKRKKDIEKYYKCCTTHKSLEMSFLAPN